MILYPAAVIRRTRLSSLLNSCSHRTRMVWMGLYFNHSLGPFSCSPIGPVSERSSFLGLPEHIGTRWRITVAEDVASGLDFVVLMMLQHQVVGMLVQTNEIGGRRHWQRKPVIAPRLRI